MVEASPHNHDHHHRPRRKPWGPRLGDGYPHLKALISNPRPGAPQEGNRKHAMRASLQVVTAHVRAANHPVSVYAGVRKLVRTPRHDTTIRQLPLIPIRLP